MLMPGFSSTRFPRNVRLLFAVSITLALTPLLLDAVGKSPSNLPAAALAKLCLAECLIGALIGFLARIFFGALETLGTAIAMSIGLSSVLSPPLQEAEPLPPITSLVTLTATALIFFSDLHLEILRALTASYAAIPISSVFDARFDLAQVTDCLSKSFLICLRISIPFLVYALVVNFAIGLASKLVPQISLYFVTAPAVILGGLFLLYTVCRPFMQIFHVSFAAWLLEG